MLWTFGLVVACVLAAAFLIPVISFLFPEAEVLRPALAPVAPPADKG